MVLSAMLENIPMLLRLPLDVLTAWASEDALTFSTDIIHKFETFNKDLISE